MKKIQFEEYLNSLRNIAGLEIINFNKTIKKVYCGMEISGIPHIGSWIYFLFLDYLSKEYNIKTYLLLADLHTKLNNKKQYFDLKEKFIKTMPDTKVEFILGSSFQISYKYILNLLEYSHNTKIKKIYKAMEQSKRIYEDKNKISELLYPIMQILDIKYLETDLVIAGTDQRKIHMLYIDTLKEKPICFIHFPILKGINSEQKMSKSLGNTISIGCSKAQFNEKWNEYSFKDQFLNILSVIRPDYTNKELIEKIYDE